MEIEYNKQIEVTRDQYINTKRYFSGIVAFRTENGKFFIKPLMEKYIPILKQSLIKKNIC